MYRYILFDLDGTLTDPKLGITSCVQYALGKMESIEYIDLRKVGREGLKEIRRQVVRLKE